MVGGGGYTIRNVSRCWAYETSILVDTVVSNDLPYNDYYSYFGPDFKLHPNTTTRIDNLNTRAYLDNLKGTILRYVRRLQGAPSVQMHYVPTIQEQAEDLSEPDPDKRASINLIDSLIERDEEYESEGLDDI